MSKRAKDCWTKIAKRIGEAAKRRGVGGVASHRCKDQPIKTQLIESKLLEEDKIEEDLTSGKITPS